MTAEDVREHRVGSESFVVPETSAEAIRRARAAGRPIMAVGTTVTRALEGVAAANHGEVVAGEGETDLVITPGYEFAIVDALPAGFEIER